MRTVTNPKEVIIMADKKLEELAYKKPTEAEKKAVAKKAAAKAPAKKAPAKTASKAPAKKASKVNFVIQSSANQGITYEDVIAKVNGAFAGTIESLDIYVKAEEGKAYYVINKDITGAVDLF